MKYKSLVSFLLRAGLATVFLYAAVASFLDPFSWIGFFPEWLRGVFDANSLLMIFSTFEIGFALWLLSGYKAFYSALVAAGTMLAIISANLGLLDIVFRDVAILFSALALVALEANEAKKSESRS